MGNSSLRNLNAACEGGRDFWRAVLLDGGFTVLPRWTLNPVDGVGEHLAIIPAALLAKLDRLAAALSVRPATLLLAAHAKVLGVLSGEREVTVGYAVACAPPLPLRLSLEAGSWRELLQQTARVESELWAHRDFPVSELERELGLGGPSFESVFEAEAAASSELAAATVLTIGLAPDDQLRLCYRQNAFDTAAGVRIASYHLAALASMAADLDAAHEQQSLLCAEELYALLHGMAGPLRKLPDKRAHELFEDQMRAQPDAIAAVYGEQQRSYRQLNGMANRLARLLLANGLAHEGVVAVVSERNLDWLAAVLAIFKAGGAYLPIEPHFPVERISKTLMRADCRLVLSERGSSSTLDPALALLPETSRLWLDAAEADNLSDDNLGIEVAPGQLAYIYFTSGSTGEPKGAMCEHAGMLNHLFAKIDDLEIDRDAVVAQTAPQSFDISLWQLLAPLLVGGRTLLVRQSAIMDARRFVDTIVSGRVNVVQVVPSYLDVVLAYLEQHPRELPDLRYLSVTGEALKTSLAQRWFVVQPGIRLVNAYGLTETSDDTNHEVMEVPPRHERVPLGRPISNVCVYIVDDLLSPVPLGAPGEIVFSGICVGRGYINDPERTRRAFVADPYRPGNRLYRSGDYGRWLPDGKLEYLGRRDSQVKISGFRIEIGEIENALLRVPGVRDGAVVMAERGNGRQLAAFYTGERELAAATLRESLRASLPAYMLPSFFQWLSTLPLTTNGKTDRKALQTLAATAGETAPASTATLTPTERKLVGVWAEVLGITPTHIGRDAHFFELGGTSLAALQLLVRLNRALDRPLSLQELGEHPALADLAWLLDERAGQGRP